MISIAFDGPPLRISIGWRGRLVARDFARIARGFAWGFAWIAWGFAWIVETVHAPSLQAAPSQHYRQ